MANLSNSSDDSSSNSDNNEEKKDISIRHFNGAINVYVKQIDPLCFDIADDAIDSITNLLVSFCTAIRTRVPPYMKLQNRNTVKKQDMMTLCLSNTNNTIFRVKILKMNIEKSHIKVAYIKRILSYGCDNRFSRQAISYISCVLDLILSIIFEKFSNQKLSREKITIRKEDVSEEVEKLLSSIKKEVTIDTDAVFAANISSITK